MKQIQIIPTAFIALAAFLWGLDGVVLRPALYTLPVALVVCIEHTAAFLFMAPFFWVERKQLKALRPADWLAFLWVAIFGGVLGTIFITKALFYVNFVNLSVVILIQKLQPVFALLLAWLVLKEKMPRKFFGWAIIAVCAAYVITFDGLVPNLSTGDKTTVAALFSLGAAFAWGSSTVFSKRALRNVSYRLGTYIRFGLTAFIMLILVGLLGEFSQVVSVSPWQWATFLIIVFSSGGLAMFLYYYGLRRVTASVSTIAELTFPLTAIILEFLIRGRVLTWTQWLGAAALLLAMYQVSLIQKKLG